MKLNQPLLSNSIIDYVFIAFLVISTVFFSSLIINDYNAASFLYDDSIYVNVANNVRNGNGFTVDLIFGTSSVDKQSMKYVEDATAQSIINEHPKLNWEYGKAPLFFLLLAGYFEITHADASNWVFLSSIFNIIISVIFIIIYFIFCKRYFGRIISMLSSFVLISSLVFITNSTTAEPNPLVYLFILLSLFFLNQNNKNYFLFGLIAGLASLSNQIGAISFFSYSFFLLLNKEFKGLLIVSLSWILVVSPWMIHQYYAFNDFGNGLAIPFSKMITSLIQPINEQNISSKLPIESVSLNHLPFSYIQKTFLDYTYFNEILIFFLVCSVFSFISFTTSRNKISTKLLITLFLITLTTIIIFFTYIQIQQYLMNNFLLNTLIQFGIIFVPIILLIKIDKTRKNPLTDRIPRPFLIFGSLIFIGFLINYWIYLILDVNFLTFFPVFFVSIPLGIYGIVNFCRNFSSEKNKGKTEIIIYSVIIIVVLSSSIIFIPEILHFATHHSNLQIEETKMEKIHQYIRENINSDAVLMDEFPGSRFIRTGNPIVKLPEDYFSNPNSFSKYLDNFNVEYVIKKITPYEFTESYFDLLGFKTIMAYDDMRIFWRNNTNTGIFFDNPNKIKSMARINYFEKNFKLNINYTDIENEISKIMNDDKKLILVHKDLHSFLNALIETTENDIEKEKFKQNYNNLLQKEIEFKNLTIEENKSLDHNEYELVKDHNDIYLLLDNLIKSSNNATEIEKLRQTYKDTLRNEVEYWKEKNEHNHMIDVYNKWISFDKFDSQAWRGMAQTLEEVNETKRAVNAYEFLLKLEPENENEIQKKISELSINMKN